MNASTRVRMIRAMDFVARQLNDEDIFFGWLLNGVADEAVAEQCLILLRKSFLTHLLFDELPVFVVLAHALLLCLGIFRIVHDFLVVGEELLEQVDVEHSRLLVGERSLAQQLALTGVDDLLYFCIGYGETEGFSLVLDDLLADEVVPSLITQLNALLLGEVLVAVAQFNGVLILVAEFVEVLIINVFAIDLTDNLVSGVLA